MILNFHKELTNGFDGIAKNIFWWINWQIKITELVWYDKKVKTDSAQ